MLTSLFTNKTMLMWLLRKGATVAGSALVADGIITHQQIADAIGAGTVLYGIAHSLYLEWPKIKTEIVANLPQIK